MGPHIAKRLRIGTQRPTPCCWKSCERAEHAVEIRAGGDDRARRDIVLDPVDHRGHLVETVGRRIAAAVTRVGNQVHFHELRNAGEIDV